MNPAGYWLSEKLDGCRCFLTESGRMLSRNGRDFRPPAWFTAGLPKGIRLDGELFAGRGGFDELVSTIQRKGSDWEGITFQIFDLAQLRQPIENRLAALARLSLPPHCQLVPHRVCVGSQDLDATEAAIVAEGGEGVCLRAPESYYRPGNFWKIKRLFADLNRSVLD